MLVAGGATGIGAATVRAFRAEGHRVLLADVNAVVARRVVAEDLPGRADFAECDLGSPDGPRAAVAAAVRLGEGELDTVFYNAAVLEARTLEDWDVDAWDASVAVNLRGPFLVTQAAAPYLRASSAGSVVLTSSTGALRGHAGMPAYHATKAGILGLVRSLADELGPAGVTVNAICPGWVETPFNDSYWRHQADPEGARAALDRQIPLRRQAAPEEIPGLVLFLASGQARYVTGQSFVIDGGYTAV